MIKGLITSVYCLVSQVCVYLEKSFKILETKKQRHRQFCETDTDDSITIAGDYYLSN